MLGYPGPPPPPHWAPPRNTPTGPKKFRWGGGQGLSLNVPHATVCPVGGGGCMWGIFRKPLKGAIWNTLGLHAVLTVCLRFSSFLDGGGLPAASFCQQAATMSSYKFTPRAVASPDAPQKPLVHKRARSQGANWVRVTRHPEKLAEPCMHPQGTPNSVHRRGLFFCQSILGW